MSTDSSKTELPYFHSCTGDLFRQAFVQPTKVQLDAWPAIASGKSTLLLAPTGSGKTLAAFMAAIDRLFFGTANSIAEQQAARIAASISNQLADVVSRQRGIKVLYI